MNDRESLRKQPVKSPFTINLTPQNLSLECPVQPSIAMNIEQVRFNMVEQQIRTWDVLDTDVLDLLHTLKRENFVPPAQREFALMDIETPLAPVCQQPSACGRPRWKPA